jgi:hypothetical protein
VTASKLAALEDDGTGEAAAGSQGAGPAAKAKGKLVSALMKKHLVEALVPAMVELRHMLQVMEAAGHCTTK